MTLALREVKEVLKQAKEEKGVKREDPTLSEKVAMKRQKEETEPEVTEETFECISDMKSKLAVRSLHSFVSCIYALFF